MVNKIVTSIIIVLMLLGIAIYFRVEFKYMMVLNGRGSSLLSQYKKALKDPTTNGESIEDRVGALAEKNGYKFATDYIITENFLFKSCKEQCLQNTSFFKNYIKIISHIKIKNLWVVERNKMKDEVAYYIQEREENQFVNNFKQRRTFITDNYDKLSSYELKELALTLTQAMDAKVLEITKK